MKKYIATVLVLVLTLLTISCNQESVDSNQESVDSNQESIDSNQESANSNQEQTKSEQNKSKYKLIELARYSSMTIEGTTSIEVVYDYINGEETTYEFVIDDQEIIAKIMAEVFNMELKDYPEDQDINFYQRWITVNQGDNEYYINLGYTSDEHGNQYLCQSRNVCEIIEKYIKDNLLK